MRRNKPGKKFTSSPDIAKFLDKRIRRRVIELKQSLGVSLDQKDKKIRAK